MLGGGGYGGNSAFWKSFLIDKLCIIYFYFYVGGLSNWGRGASLDKMFGTRFAIFDLLGLQLLKVLA